MKSLLDITSLSTQCVHQLFNRASDFKKKLQQKKLLPHQPNQHIMVNLFYEPSTRTQYSFDIAAHHLGIKTINPDMSGLSHRKGESLEDTVRTFQQMGADLFTIRHQTSHTPHKLSHACQARVINAGDGNHQHPSQALIDAFTILQHKNTIADLNIAILGDIAQSRVARSNIELLTKLGVQNIRTISPEELSQDSPLPNTQHFTCTAEGLQQCDVVMALRIQFERHDKNLSLDVSNYSKRYKLTQELLTHAHQDAIVLHPGPVNRNVEICEKIIHSQRSKISDQVANGVAIRMAIIDQMIST